MKYHNGGEPGHAGMTSFWFSGGGWVGWPRLTLSAVATCGATLVGLGDLQSASNGKTAATRRIFIEMEFFMAIFSFENFRQCAPSCGELQRIKSKRPPALFSDDGHENYVVDNHGSAPTTAHPDIPVAAMAPVTGHPNCVRVRARRPTSGHPDPVTAPFPTAGHPKPKIQRPRRDGHDFNPRRRRIFRLFDNRLVRRRGRLDHGPARAFHNATREQWQSDANQKTFGQN